MSDFTGCVDSQKLHMAYGLSDGFRYKIIVTFSDLKAREIFEDYQFYDREVTWYPAKDLIFYQADIHGNQLVTERMKALRKNYRGKAPDGNHNLCCADVSSGPSGGDSRFCDSY